MIPIVLFYELCGMVSGVGIALIIVGLMLRYEERHSILNDLAECEEG